MYSRLGEYRFDTEEINRLRRSLCPKCQYSFSICYSTVAPVVKVFTVSITHQLISTVLSSYASILEYRKLMQKCTLPKMIAIAITIRNRLQRLQSILNFEGWGNYPQFSNKQFLGRVALIGCLLGFFLGLHILVCGQLWIQYYYIGMTQGQVWFPRYQLMWQWSVYASALCIFHLAEFFVTALYNPTQVTADSFLVNHSIAYTTAAMSSWIEFALRCTLAPDSVYWNIPRCFVYSGLAMIVLAQCLRSLAMATAGESFNHIIQSTKKNNHILITHGVYQFLRHPSYVGFFYWSIGTQLLLGNPIHTVLYAVASWNFFHRRTAYEEESLCAFFPESYPDYVARTYSGIPFLRTQIYPNVVHPNNSKSKLPYKQQ